MHQAHPSPRSPAPIALGPSDEELVRGYLAADPSCGHRIYQRHSRFLFATAIRLMRNREQAEDLLQDTFVIAFSKMDQLQNPAALSGWLRQILISTAYKRFRRATLLRKLGIGPSLHAQELDVLSEDVQGNAELQSSFKQAWSQIQQLPSDERIIYLLREIEELSFPDISQTLQLSISTVKRRHAKAQQRLERWTRETLR